MIPVDWAPRDPPLLPLGVAGRGDVAARLARRVLASRGAPGWRAVVGDRLLVVLGDALPWVDGVVYLGADPRAPRLLHDSRLMPSVPPDLLARRIHARVPGLVAWLHAPDVLVPLADAEPIHPPALSAWLERAVP
ncbi:MAG: hypothetical protein R3F61_31325 [Myxococcota bacterium]